VRGFVPTPPEIVNHMVGRLFRGRIPKGTDNLLDPGCGNGAFLAGVLRWCRKRGIAAPAMVGIESEPGRASRAVAAFDGNENVQIRRSDFLAASLESFDFVIGNPPYVSIYALSGEEKSEYRAAYETARGRFDLYLLFFERALKSLKPGGRLVFITPEKFLYVETAAPLRRLLSAFQIEEIELINEASFAGLVTYPTVTTVVNRPHARATSMRLRDGSRQRRVFSDTGTSWMPIIRGAQHELSDSPTLEDICIRVSCGVATGADDVFVRKAVLLEPDLAAFARPTVAGRELTMPGEIEGNREYAMLIPYSDDGALLPERSLGALKRYLSPLRARLLERTCARRKPWYAFHETPPLPEILRPKILCKDITEKPQFWIDRCGALVPRHSVYYIVPMEPATIDRLCSFLNSSTAAQWLVEHCQRAANGFLRLQSNVLKAMPLPDELARPRRREVASYHRRAELEELGDPDGAVIR
jgi:adenine-specific DNA-methyltransferase